MYFGCIFAMACQILLCVLCFANGNDAFAFLGDPADYFEPFLVLDSIFGAISSLRFEFWCHSAILCRGFEFLTILSTGFEFWCNSSQLRSQGSSFCAILIKWFVFGGAPGQAIFKPFERRVRVCVQF